MDIAARKIGESRETHVRTCRPPILSFSLAALLLAVTLALLPPTRDAHAHAISVDTPPEAIESFSGVVVEVWIDNHVTHRSAAYRELRLDDGTVLSLTGPAADTLQGG